MIGRSSRIDVVRRAFTALIFCAAMMRIGIATASTYVVYIPLDSPIYDQLDTLNSLGYLDTYLAGIKPIARVEAARLVLEADHNLENASHRDALASEMLRSLHLQLGEEIGWLVNNREDNLPTMVHPIQRFEAGCIYSHGDPRYWRTGPSGIQAQEETPLLPDNDALPTGSGSNEVARLSGWGGFGGFLSAYGEGAVAGPITHSLQTGGRARVLGAESVVSLGNFALSFGQQEMNWGLGKFGSVTQSDNAQPFPALRAQNIHPFMLPWVFRYLGQFRYSVFFGQLDHQHQYSRPWIDGQIFEFKPLPNFEFGLTHAIQFGGHGNDFYNLWGFLGRATAFSTGSASEGNTNSRGGVFARATFPSLGGAQVYQEVMGEDNLNYEVPGAGRFLPFLARTWQGGVYVPRLTGDGLTDFRVEYIVSDSNYSTHSDSLYWSYKDQTMGNYLGPNATGVHLVFGRWFDLRYKGDVDLFYTDQAPSWADNTPYPAEFYPYSLSKERSGGVAFDLLKIPGHFPLFGASAVDGMKARGAVEYAHALNYERGTDTVRFLISVSLFLDPGLGSWSWK